MNQKEMHVMQAEEALKIGMPQLALEQCELGLEIDIKELRFYRIQATAHLNLRNYSETVSNCCRVLKDVKDASTYLIRAQAYLGLGQENKALEDCEEAAKRAPKNVTLYIVRAQVYRKLKRYDDALEDCRLGLELCDELNLIYKRKVDLYLIRVGIYYKELGKTDEAQADIATIQKIVNEWQKMLSELNIPDFQ